MNRGHQRSWRGTERAEAKPLVERHGVLVNRVHDYCTDRDLLGRLDDATDRVVQKGCADALALLADIDS